MDPHGFFNSYQFTSAWVGPIQKSFTEFLLLLKENPTFAKGLLNSIFRWLDRVKVQVDRLREIELEESEKIGPRDEWIEWMHTNNIWSQLNL